MLFDLQYSFHLYSSWDRTDTSTGGRAWTAHTLAIAASRPVLNIGPGRRKRRSPGRDSPPEISSSTGEEQPNLLLQERANCEELAHVECLLDTKDLWEKFNELGTEMIITKTGRSVLT
ncbi:unnamed protein product [Nezara viridula]|uniref:T-box domain-containing protein n=1 Tax=Nezara viridula TaxID=85310 RepID=A0A9P0E1T4_NEZVI|nr:unnamed protein product [Nezara viridula]